MSGEPGNGRILPDYSTIIFTIINAFSFGDAGSGGGTRDYACAGVRPDRMRNVQYFDLLVY